MIHIMNESEFNKKPRALSTKFYSNILEVIVLIYIFWWFGRKKKYCGKICRNINSIDKL